MKIIKHSLLFILAAAMLSSCKTDSTEEMTTPKGDAVKINTAQLKNKLKTAKIDVSPENAKTISTKQVASGMDWNSIDDLEQLVANDKKKVLIDVYTSWCGWCKVMDKQTFSDPEVQSYLDENFHVVKFNAEQKDPISYRGQTYELVRSGRRSTNALAVELLNGRLGYPSLVMLDENLKKIKVSPGFKKPDQLLAELKTL